MRAAAVDDRKGVVDIELGSSDPISFLAPSVDRLGGLDLAISIFIPYP